jgi:hypothetical protein
MITKQGGINMINTDERILNIEELLSNIHSNKRTMNKTINKAKIEEDKTVNKPKHMSNNLTIGMIILITLFAALGTMVIMLKAEVADFSGLKEQIAAMAANDSKFKITIIEDKLEASEKEKESLKKELVQIKNTIETLKSIQTVQAESKKPTRR